MNKLERQFDGQDRLQTGAAIAAKYLSHIHSSLFIGELYHTTVQIQQKN